MSYDIYLADPITGDTLELDAPHSMRGGTYQAGGSKHAWLNITYNYAQHFSRVFEPRGTAPGGIRSIYGMTGADSIPILEAAAAKLGNNVSEDYWEATEGNARRALLQLAALAKMRPDGVWQGD